MRAGEMKYGNASIMFGQTVLQWTRGNASRAVWSRIYRNRDEDSVILALLGDSSVTLQFY